MPARQSHLRARFTLDDTSFHRGIANIGRGVTRARGLIAPLAGAMMGLAGITAAAAGGFSLGTIHAFNLGSEMDELSKRTGVAAGTLMVIGQAMKDAGLEAESAGPLINRMQRYIQAVGDKGLGKLGITIQNLKSLAPEEQFFAIGRAINAIPTAAGRANAAIAIFGRAGGRLLPLFADAKAMTDAATVIGKQADLMSRNSALFDAVSDRLKHAGTKIQGFFVGAASEVASSLLPFLERLDHLDLVSLGQRFGRELVRSVKDAAEVAVLIVGFFRELPALAQAAGSFLRNSFLRVIPELWGGLKDVVAGLSAAWIVTNNRVINAISEGLLAVVNWFSQGWTKAIWEPIKGMGERLFKIAVAFGGALAGFLAGNILGGTKSAANILGATKNPLKEFVLDAIKTLPTGGNTDFGKEFKTQRGLIDKYDPLKEWMDKMDKQGTEGAAEAKRQLVKLFSGLGAAGRKALSDLFIRDIAPALKSGSFWKSADPRNGGIFKGGYGQFAGFETPIGAMSLAGPQGSGLVTGGLNTGHLWDRPETATKQAVQQKDGWETVDETLSDIGETIDDLLDVTKGAWGK